MVRPEITNKNGNPNYKYFYSNADQGSSTFGDAEWSSDWSMTDDVLCQMPAGGIKV